ncbi:hypothetical protein Ahy_A02g009388 isoform A [Arachis hypogaea]|uniref:Uncharacterized protein n=1 Tax=Arachis hypogaea TaxID=3818 RepID=A0A445EGV2_ARAHY|nr:hypothetical protein Ahy_A02g009388 isoform A [Arachis hypogaea]
MTTILNPIMADHELKFDRLARQVKWIARNIDYDYGERHDARGNNEGFENIFQNENNVLRNRENPQIILRDQNTDDALARLHANQGRTLKKEKEKYENEKRLKSKPFTQKEKVAYVAMESSEEESDLEAEVDLAELKKGPPYVCSLHKKLPGNKKLNDSKLKSGKRYSFDILKFDHIFDQRLKDRDVSLCP